jgi:hypothetical protein
MYRGCSEAYIHIVKIELIVIKWLNIKFVKFYRLTYSVSKTLFYVFRNYV